MDNEELQFKREYLWGLVVESMENIPRPQSTNYFDWVDYLVTLSTTQKYINGLLVGIQLFCNTGEIYSRVNPVDKTISVVNNFEVLCFNFEAREWYIKKSLKEVMGVLK